MNERKAKQILTGPLKFGDDEQIRAVRFIEKCDAARAAGEDVPCEECNGCGYFNCGECDGTGDSQDDDGETECEYCGGEGTTQCEECDGTGQLNED